MIPLGYVEADEGNQLFQTALNLRYLVAALNLLGMLLAWICIKFVYNLDKKTVTEMEAALGHKVKES